MSHVFWYCEDCGARGTEVGDATSYDTLRLVGIDHRATAANAGNGKCVGMHIRVGDKAVWPDER